MCSALAGGEGVADLAQQHGVLGGARRRAGEVLLLGARVGQHDEEVDDGGEDHERDDGVHEGAEGVLLVAEVVAGALGHLRGQPVGEGRDDRAEGGADDDRDGQVDEVPAQQEGLEAAHARHAAAHQQLKAGLEPMGISFVVPEDERLPQLNSVIIPEGVDDAEIRGRLLNEYNLEIGSGLGALAGKVWRIGLMGDSARKEKVLFCLAALKEVLGK